MIDISPSNFDYSLCFIQPNILPDVPRIQCLVSACFRVCESPLGISLEAPENTQANTMVPMFGTHTHTHPHHKHMHTAAIKYPLLNYMWHTVLYSFQVLDLVILCFIHYSMIPMTNLVTSCHHTELLQCGWLYFLSCTLHLWDFDSLLLLLASIQKHHCHSQCQRAYGLCFLLGVLSFQAIQRIHFCVRKWSSLILLHVAVQFLQQHLLNRPSFPCHVPLPPMT